MAERLCCRVTSDMDEGRDRDRYSECPAELADHAERA